MPTTVEKLPHFEYDIFIDGVQIFKNAEKPTLTPILGRVHSISHCYDSAAPPRRIDNSQPCILGFFQGTSKPNIKKFLRALISELKRLHPKNRNTSETSGRQFTVSLRCIIADTPMRSYLKRIISCNGYWACERCVQMGIPKRFKGRKKAFIELRDLNAPKRLNCNFLGYTKSDKSNEITF
ncbi:Uncharacterized protein APZ42_004508 [Daphnia magna]|uniref:Uncharacterized protein n=1 Tax=Daphnia magna TaxID=35525 RepID=A0A162C0D1_9CRUS|nr:Uncharacterized protein APZ42_004508 [Daphnia magna]